MKREPFTSTVVCGRPRRRDQLFDRGEVPGPFPEGLDGGAAQRPRRIQAIDAALARVGADLPVEFRSLLAHFPHVAEQEELRAAMRREHVDRGSHRIRIRVVAVVDELRSRAAGSALHASADRMERREAPRDRFEPRTRRQGARRRGADVQRVVAAVGVQLYPCRALWSEQLDLASEMRELVAAAHLRGPVDAEVADAPAGEKPAPITGEVVVGVDHADAVGPQRREYRAVLARDFGDAVHELLVLPLGVVDERHRRARDRGERGGLPGMIHPQLDHRRAVVLAEPEQCQRKADVVVEISLGRERVRLPEVRPQDRRDHFPDRGLAVRAADRDERDVEATAPVRREPSQRTARVVDHEQRQPRVPDPRPRVFHDHRRSGAAFFCRVDEPVPVESLAAQRNEQRASRKCAAVGRHRVETGVVAAHTRPKRRRGLAQAHHRLHPESACFASSASEKGSRRPAISW